MEWLLFRYTYLVHSYKVEGIILKRTNFGEADRFLTVFTKEKGKISVLAKGIRRITSRRAGSVELFNQAILFLHKGRNFDILTEATTLNTFPHFRLDFQKVGAAYYACELIDRLTPEEQEHDAVYELLVKFLTWLEGQPNNSKVTLALSRFDKRLLTDLGYWSTRMDGQVDLKNFIKELIGGEVRSEKFLAMGLQKLSS